MNSKMTKSLQNTLIKFSWGFKGGVRDTILRSSMLELKKSRVIWQLELDKRIARGSPGFTPIIIRVFRAGIGFTHSITHRLRLT